MSDSHPLPVAPVFVSFIQEKAHNTLHEYLVRSNAAPEAIQLLEDLTCLAHYLEKPSAEYPAQDIVISAINGVAHFGEKFQEQAVWMPVALGV